MSTKPTTKRVKLRVWEATDGEITGRSDTENKALTSFYVRRARADKEARDRRLLMTKPAPYVPVQGLEVPDKMERRQVTASAAMRMAMERARAAQPCRLVNMGSNAMGGRK